jgi:predicted transcriptional regulator
MLAELGVTDRQETVYYALIDRPGADLDQLATRSGLTRSVVARALAQLHHHGLATRLPGRVARYTAITPALALDVLVRQRADRLDEVRRGIADLTERFQSASRFDGSQEMVEIVHGDDAVHQRWLQLQRSAQSVIRVFDKPPYIDPGNPAEPAMLDQGIAYKTVYDRTALDVPGKLPGIWEAYEAGEDCRIAANLPLKLFIADERMALAPLRESADVDSAIVVHASALLSALIALFEAVWARAVPLQDRTKQIEESVRLSELQRKLLDLLDAGLTDEAIARHLGVSYRTVQRRISELMDIYGAQTRFQLGVQTARDSAGLSS